MKVVALIPIKLNSQRVPHKNILPIGGKPLCWHVCNALNQVDRIDEVYVYCSSDEVKKYIPPETKFLRRPAELDADCVKGFQIYERFISSVDADVYILAHTTSPFLKTQTINEALAKVLSGEFDSSFSAKRIQTFCWYRNMPINYNLNDVPRTQDMEPVFVETSSFYIFKKEVFTIHHRRIGFKPFLKEVDDIESIDIDEKSDYEYACKIADMLGGEHR